MPSPSNSTYLLALLQSMDDAIATMEDDNDGHPATRAYCYFRRVEMDYTRRILETRYPELWRDADEAETV